VGTDNWVSPNHEDLSLLNYMHTAKVEVVPAVEAEAGAPGSKPVAAGFRSLLLLKKSLRKANTAQGLPYTLLHIPQIFVFLEGSQAMIAQE
jgi:hypothetical protein